MVPTSTVQTKALPERRRVEPTGAKAENSPDRNSSLYRVGGTLTSNLPSRNTGNTMGRLTEIIDCSLRTQAEINLERLSRLDLSDPKTNSDLIKLRAQQKRVENKTLFEME